MKHLLQALAIILLCSGASPAQDPVLAIGVASGFPPYQYAVDGQPAGLDVDVARAVAARLGLEPRFVQSDWDSVVGWLRVGRIDILAGMESNEFRQAYFDFTRPYAKRHDAVFIRADSQAGKVEDLYGQLVSGDRHSYVELLWRREGILPHIRITQTATKEEAMRLLAEGKTAAAIMPLEVGRFLARDSGVDVRVLVNPDPGSDVAIAVRKGRNRLREDADAALAGMLEDGQLDALHRKWLAPPADGNALTGPPKRSTLAGVDDRYLVIERPEIIDVPNQEEPSRQHVQDARDPFAHVHAVHPEKPQERQEDPGQGIVEAARAEAKTGVSHHGRDEEQVHDPADEEKPQGEEVQGPGNGFAVVEAVRPGESKNPEQVAHESAVRVDHGSGHASSLQVFGMKPYAVPGMP